MNEAHRFFALCLAAAVFLILVAPALTPTLLEGSSLSLVGAKPDCDCNGLKKDACPDAPGQTCGAKVSKCESTTGGDTKLCSEGADNEACKVGSNVAVCGASNADKCNGTNCD